MPGDEDFLLAPEHLRPVVALPMAGARREIRAAHPADVRHEQARQEVRLARALDLVSVPGMGPEHRRRAYAHYLGLDDLGREAWLREQGV